jgi:hypothetical protein
MIPVKFKHKECHEESNSIDSEIIFIGNDQTRGVLVERLNEIMETQTHVLGDYIFEFKDLVVEDIFIEKKKKPHHAKRRKGWER